MAWYRQPIIAQRVRVIERPFAWLPCRLLTRGSLAVMPPRACQLYLLLALASDRQGLSFYGDKKICSILSMSYAELHQARNELQRLDLVAFDGQTYQLLSLPTHHQNHELRSPEIRDQNRSVHDVPTSPQSITNQATQPQRKNSGISRNIPEHIHKILNDLFNS